jgi:hypothetical protein
MAFNKFKNKNKKNSAGKGSPQEGPVRVKLPREGEILEFIKSHVI